MRRYTDSVRAMTLAILLPLLLTGCVSSVFYYPDRVLYGTPEKDGLRYESVAFSSADGTKLTGWFVPAATVKNPRKAKGTVVHFHGNAKNISSHWRYVSWLPKRGFNVFVFDYRGYGASHGKPEPKGVFEDSRAALSYVRTRNDVDPQRLFVLGQSLGGNNAIAVVGSGNREGVKAVAIEGTFYSYASIANDRFPGAGLIVDNTYSASKYVKDIAPIPLLLIHGMDDRIVPYDHSVRLLKVAGEPKAMMTIKDGSHIDAFTSRYGAKYQDILVNFFEGNLKLFVSN